MGRKVNGQCPVCLVIYKYGSLQGTQAQMQAAPSPSAKCLCRMRRTLSIGHSKRGLFPKTVGCPMSRIFIIIPHASYSRLVMLEMILQYGIKAA